MFGTNFGGPLVAALAQFVHASDLTDKVRTHHLFGYTDNVDVANARDVWNYSTKTYPYQSTATALTAVSSSAQDSAGGTGVSTVYVQGLDADWLPVSEVLVLEGALPVLTVNDYIRITKVTAIAPGTVGDNTATLAGDFSLSAGSDVLGFIAAGATSTKMSMFTIPKGYTGFLTHVALNSGPNDDFVVEIQTRQDGGLFNGANDLQVANNAPVTLDLFPPAGPLPERSDIKFRARGTTNNGAVRLNCTVVLVETAYLEELALSV